MVTRRILSQLTVIFSQSSYRSSQFDLVTNANSEIGSEGTDNTCSILTFTHSHLLLR